MTRGKRAIPANWAERLGRSPAAQEAAKIIKTQKPKSELERQYEAAIRQAKRDKLDSIVAKQMAGLPEFVTELEFHPERRFRFDYAWPQRRVALEIHGGVFQKSRHTTGVGFTKDKAKMNEATCLGWLVVEVTTEQLKSGEARDWVERTLALRGA